jgi:hypothetical protein
MWKRLLKPLAWVMLPVLAMTSCSSAMNVRPDDYGRIEADSTYRIVMVDGREYKAINLVVKGDVASFTHDRQPVTVPVKEIQLIQKLNEHAVMTGVMGLGVAAAIVGGLVLIMKPD